MILPLEKQVCSLESSKRLKELGFPQFKSLFYWVEQTQRWTIYGKAKFDWSCDTMNHIDGFSAYTVAELGELLPIHIKEDWWHLVCSKQSNGFYIVYKKKYKNRISIEPNNAILENTEAEARAKMLIYLKENNLI